MVGSTGTAPSKDPRMGMTCSRAISSSERARSFAAFCASSLLIGIWPRRAAVVQTGLRDKGGIALDPKGFIVADDEYRTSAAGTYAVGDVIGQPQFTHTAWDDHRILFDLLMGRSRRGRRGRHIPYTAFTDPQVAGVGLTEREARERGIQYEVATMRFAEVA